MTPFQKLKSFTALFLLMCLLGCSPKVVYQSSWQSVPVVADGEANEWKIPLRFYDPSTKLNYTISNDKDNLYICIRAVDVVTQLKIMKAGMQIWIDTTSKKGKQIGLEFPMPHTLANEGNEKNKNGGYSNTSSNSGDRPSPESVHRSFLTQATEMELTGFKSPIGGITALVNNYGIKIGMNWDSSDILIYEAIIPFKTFCNSFNDSTKTFSIGVVLNALPSSGNSESGRGGGGGGGMHNGGGGGGMGGGMGGGGGGMHGGGGGHGGGYNSNSDEKAELYESENFWVYFHLAHK